MGEAGSEGTEAGEVVVPVICGGQTVQLIMNISSDPREVLIPGQAEEEVVKNARIAISGAYGRKIASALRMCLSIGS